MLAHEPRLPIAQGWQARLDLRFERRPGRDDATVLASCRHFGPLRVQKALHPEGPGICHAIVLHPPSGIVGGDQLDIAIDVGDGARALLTTPGAGKWYRSAGALAAQRLHLRVGARGTAEWLPQETIVYSGAQANIASQVDLAADARFLGWEVLCLGRRACGEDFSRGALRLANRITREGRPLWLERGRIDGGSPLLDSPIGLAGFSVCGTLLATGDIDPSLLADCRGVAAAEAGARLGVTALPGPSPIFVARYLGHSSEAARHWFVGLWQHLRPALLGIPARTPRIWNT
ncbi:MAG: urease accessory protein UreD [Sulfuritalea sp.]|nr:urease accessory protein UreD [Sulfuritalea sp.]